MYTSHPLHNEFFDFDDFVLNHQDILRELFLETKNMIEPDETEENDLLNRASLVSLAVCHEITSFEGQDPRELIFQLEESDTERMNEFFNGMIFQCRMYNLEMKGLINLTKDGFIELTSFGKQWAKRKNRRNDGSLPQTTDG